MKQSDVTKSVIDLLLKRIDLNEKEELPKSTNDHKFLYSIKFTIKNKKLHLM